MEIQITSQIKLIIVCSLLVQISCISKDTNKIIQKDMSKTLREKEIPPELQKQIDSNTVFMYAKISRNKIDYISNILYKLDNNLVFTRKTNEQQPPDNRLFFCNDN